jgi:hypothetical protein
MNKEYFNATHRHIKSGNVYMKLCVSNLAAVKKSWVRTVVYKDEIGNIWSIPLEKFKEKFEEI